MNRATSGFLPFNKALEGFLQFKLAEGISRRTYISYQHDLILFMKHHENPNVSEIDSMMLTKYLSWLRVEYKPKRKSGDERPLSPKTIRNHWVSLSSFFRWFSMEFDTENPMRKVPAPKFEKAQIDPFTQDEIKDLLKACTYTKKAKTYYRQSFNMRRPTAKRDRAIILTLLDTGLRAGELCSLLIGDFELSTGKLVVKEGPRGGAKGGKGRHVYLGKIARKTLWRYLVDREDGQDPLAPLFLTKHNRPMTPNGLRQLVVSIAKKANISGCYPHRFRHTFAITYLRSGGDIFTLQSLLGHSSLEMVRHYARIAQVDLERAHRRASPVDNWRL